MHARLRPFLPLVLASLALLLAGCALFSSRHKDPFDLTPFQTGLLPVAQADLTQAEHMPFYRLDLRIDPVAREVKGRARVSVPNTGDRPLQELYFRLYPNILQYAGIMIVDGLTVDDEAAGFTYAAQDTALQLILPRPVPPKQRVEVEISYTLQVPRRDEGYVLFGASQGILSLPVAYPVLALREGAAWKLDIAPPQADAAFSEASFYLVTATVPSGITIAPSGRVVTTTAQSDGSIVWQIASGPSREFAMLLSADYEMASTQAYSTTVTSYFLAGDRDAGLAALEYASASIRIYSDHYGTYPYTYMHIAEAPLTYRGQEYPGLNLLGIDLYRGSRSDLEFLTAHEVAHQWWYNLVGNDPINIPWLDEGLAEYSTFLYYQARFGQSAAERLRSRRWEGPVAYARQNGLEVRVGQPAASFSASNYESMVYAKAALFYDALRANIGESAFDAALREYARKHRWGIVTPTDLLDAIWEVTSLDLYSLYEAWILIGPVAEP